MIITFAGNSNLQSNEKVGLLGVMFVSCLGLHSYSSTFYIPMVGYFNWIQVPGRVAWFISDFLPLLCFLALIMPQRS